MAGKLVIQGIEAYDGIYDFVDLDTFTNRELHTIKQLSGVRAGELNEAYAANDNDLYVAFTVITLQRAGKFVNEDLIWDAKPGTVTFRFDEEEAAPAVPPPSGVDGSSAADETNISSGHNGVSGSENNPVTRTGTGQGSWERSSISDQPTLVISPPPN